VAEFTDIALVTQVAVLHNKKAFDQLVRKYQSPVRRFFLNQTLGDEQLSDDLAQETFIKAYMNITKFRGLSSFSTWLFRIAYNVHYDYCRKMRNEKLEMSNVDVQTCAESAFVSHHHSSFLIPNSSLKMDLYKALSQLKEEERTCITLQLIDGQPIDKISDITGIPQNTVKSHLKRGKEKLASYLKENGYDR
jgi:RNA polymerase sigma-70 factor (ECF subfamily)